MCPFIGPKIRRPGCYNHSCYHNNFCHLQQFQDVFLNQHCLHFCIFRMSAGLSLNYTLIQSQRQQKTSGMCECRSLTNNTIYGIYLMLLIICWSLLKPMGLVVSIYIIKVVLCPFQQTNMPMFLLTIIDKHQHSSQVPKNTVSDDESILSRSLIQSYI